MVFKSFAFYYGSSAIADRKFRQRRTMMNSENFNRVHDNRVGEVNENPNHSV